MFRHSTRLLIMIFLVTTLFVNQGVAQHMVTTDAVRGVLLDYPANWYIEIDEDVPEWIGFSTDSMSVGITILDLLPYDDTELSLETWIEELEDELPDIGDFSTIQPYRIDEQWDVWTSWRVRSDNYLVEILSTAIVNDFIIFFRANFRIGAQNSLLPIYDEMIASVRDSDDEIVIYSGSHPQQPLIDGTIGSDPDFLYIGALNTNFITDDEQYQFDYPDTWEVRMETNNTIIIIDRTTPDTTIFGQLIISPLDSNSDTSSLVMAQFDSPVEVSDFMLNDLLASRIIIEDEANNVRHLVMAMIKGNIQAVLNVTVSSDEIEKIESTLRATLYSVRRNGETFALSVAGDAMRRGLLSVEVYGSASTAITEIIPDNATPDTIYITDNGRFTFNYPPDWFEAFIEGYVVISNDDDIELFDPSRNDVQLLIDFLDLSGLNFADSKSKSLLENYIDNDSLSENWSLVREFDSLNRDAVYADFMVDDDDQLNRVYLVRLDEADMVYVRVDLIVDIDDLENFESTALAIIETIRFQD